MPETAPRPPDPSTARPPHQPCAEIARLMRELDQLASYSAVPAPAVSRVVFTDVDLQARAFLRELYEDAGLAVRTDAVGNVFARWAGRREELAPVATGSHIDAIPYSGRFDGTVGVLGALEAVRALRRAGFVPQRSIEIVQFTAEEPTRFGLGCLGSRLLAGVLDAASARDLRDADGATLEEVRTAVGFDGRLEAVRLPVGAYHAFVELHIEQGPELERSATPIGVVSAIAAPASLRMRFLGTGGHAGAVLMAERADALVAAAELVVAVEEAAESLGGRDTVATVGTLELLPGAINSIPSRVELGIDVRDIDGERRDLVLRAIEERARLIGSRRGVSVELLPLNADAPRVCDPRVRAHVVASCEELGLAHRELISRAYHDALFMGAVVPTAMVFVPCRGGISHRPDEHVETEHLRGGVEVLAATLARLAEEEA